MRNCKHEPVIMVIKGAQLKHYAACKYCGKTGIISDNPEAAMKSWNDEHTANDEI